MVLCFYPATISSRPQFPWKQTTRKLHVLLWQCSRGDFRGHMKAARPEGKRVCSYPAALDGVVFLLQTLLDAGLVFVRDEDEAPPFLRFGVDGKLNSFDLEEEDVSYRI